MKADGRSEVDRAIDTIVERLISPRADKASARRGVLAAVHSVIHKINDHYECLDLRFAEPMPRWARQEIDARLESLRAEEWATAIDDAAAMLASVRKRRAKTDPP